MNKTIVCTPKSLPAESMVSAARRAFKVNPANRPLSEGLLLHETRELAVTQLRLAASVTKYWGHRGVRLTVSFLDGPPAELRERILSHMNAWSRTANVDFVQTQGDGQVRIAREKGEGYWSYLGTDILEIAPDKPTMNLDSFTMQTEETEFRRAVRHEAGHTLGFEHEHLRKELVDLIDRDKAIDYFQRKYRWPPWMTVAQVLTPLEDQSVFATATADARSIMCYQLPAEITTHREPIIGGHDIDDDDFAFAAKLYPKAQHGPLEGAAQPANDGPIVVLTNSDPEYVGAVVAAMRRA